MFKEESKENSPFIINIAEIRTEHKQSLQTETIATDEQPIGNDYHSRSLRSLCLSCVALYHPLHHVFYHGERARSASGFDTVAILNIAY